MGLRRIFSKSGDDTPTTSKDTAEVLVHDGTEPAGDNESAKTRLLSRLGAAGRGVGSAVRSGVASADSSIRGFFTSSGGSWEGLSEADRAQINHAVDDRVEHMLADKALHDGPKGFAARKLVELINSAAKVQSSAIIGYVDWVRSRHPDSSPAEIQKIIDSQFKNVAGGMGGAAGIASAVPGIGLFTGSAAIVAESALFVETATIYTLASAYLRGADIEDEDRRRALILVTVVGSEGSLVADGIVGGTTMSTVRALSLAPKDKISQLNGTLSNLALRVTVRKFLPATVGKLLPFGIGAVMGLAASRALAKILVRHVGECLGPLPEAFATGAPDNAPSPPALFASLSENF